MRFRRRVGDCSSGGRDGVRYVKDAEDLAVFLGCWAKGVADEGWGGLGFLLFYGREAVGLLCIEWDYVFL